MFVKLLFKKHSIHLNHTKYSRANTHLFAHNAPSLHPHIQTNPTNKRINLHNDAFAICPTGANSMRRTPPYSIRILPNKVDILIVKYVHESL